VSFELYLPRLDATPFAVLATHGPGDRLDLVPCCFAVDGPGTESAELVTAVDHKPKRTTRLARLVNIERNPAVTLLVDHRDADDWNQLWWVRAHGRARVVDHGPLHSSAVEALAKKYPQYRQRPPAGPAVRITVDRWTGWIP